MSHREGLSGLPGMNLFVMGANGKTGTQLIDLGLARGHDVTAFVRDASRITRTHPRLTVATGDPKRTDDLARAMPGHDAVLTALGIKPRELFSPITLLQECATSTSAAMVRAGVPRLVLVSAATLFSGGGPVVLLVRFILRHQVRDLVEAERIFHASNLEWTFARPPRLDEGPREQYRSAVDAPPPRAWAMSYRAVAAFMLDAVEQHSHVREVVGLAA